MDTGERDAESWPRELPGPRSLDVIRVQMLNITLTQLCWLRLDLGYNELLHMDYFWVARSMLHNGGASVGWSTLHGSQPLLK